MSIFLLLHLLLLLTVLSADGRSLLHCRRLSSRLSCAVADPATDTTSAGTDAPPRQRRVRYAGLYPRAFREKYKELREDPSTIAKVKAKGSTPAGQHIPIMLDESLEHLGLLNSTLTSGRVLAVDCTLGFGGHSSAMLQQLLLRKDGSKLLCLDQDEREIVKAEARLREVISSFDGGKQDILRVAPTNFANLRAYLESNNLLGKVTCLLCDLGLSSMQIDDSSRGFSFKFEGPLDMRMNATSNVTALTLLQTTSARELERILAENSDEPFARQIATELLGPASSPSLPITTTEMSARIRHCMQHSCGLSKQELTKHLIDSTIKRCMQAIRIEVNQEFSSLDRLLEDLPAILAPGGRAVFLTFHSGEDRRVKKSFKANFKEGVYQAWSREVERATFEEKRSNSRSSCCKLRWCIRK